MASWANKSVILGSVGAGPYTNRANALIERATLAALDLPASTPRFSVFEPMTPQLADHINDFEVVVFTGCTILEQHHGHQRFFNQHCALIRIPKLLYAGAFCCEPADEPGDELARWFDEPLSVRDPWTQAKLAARGIDAVFVGCPTLFNATEVPPLPNGGYTLISSSPELKISSKILQTSQPVRWVSHERGHRGVDIRDEDLFKGVSATITGRLHLALPSIARGIPVRFFGPEHWQNISAKRAAGSTRLSLLDHLEISRSGEQARMHPSNQIASMQQRLADWMRLFLPGESPSEQRP